MNLKTIVPSRKEIRKQPLNLQQGDINLFQHELTKTLKETVLLTLKNADILRDSIFTIKNLKFYSLFSRVTTVKKKRLLKKFSLYIRPFQKIDKGIWIIDEFSAEYFHWFTDAIPRLITLENTDQTKQELLLDNYKILLPESYKTRSYILDSLKVLNYDVHYYPSNKRVRVKHLLCPSHTAPTGNYNSELIANIRNRFLVSQKTPNKNIYISREKAPRRKVANEKEVIGLLLQFNYEIHFFEDYNFEKQVEIMSQTKSLISLHGAGLTNMMFMQKGGQILELRNEGDDHNNCYFSLASALDHDYYYLTNNSDNEDTYHANITVDINRLRNVLELTMVKAH